MENLSNMNITLVTIGVLLLGYSFYVQTGFFGLIRKMRFLKWWGLLLLLQSFFVLGYVIFGYLLVTGAEIGDVRFLETLISFVFFFGAIFVVVTTWLIYSTVGDLVKEKGKVEKLQAEEIAYLKDKEAGFEKKIRERTVELEEVKSGLEKAVEERTSEIEEIKSHLEKTVLERTQELNEISRS